MEQIMVTVKGKPEHSKAVGNWQRHIVEMYKADRQATAILLTGVENIMCYTKEDALITLDAYFKDKAVLVIHNVLNLYITPDQKEEGPDHAEL